MSYQNDIDLAAGLFQLTTAMYALWLGLRFGASRVGWLLFSALASLALLHWALAATVLPEMFRQRILLDAACVSISILLFIGLMFLGTMFKEARSVRELLAKSEARIAAEAQKADQAKEELQQTTERLKAEIGERESQKERAEKTHKEMLEVSRQAGMSEVATSVLHNVGNVLNSVNVSAAVVADHVAEFKVENIARVAGLMREHGAGLGEFMMNDPRGKQLPNYLTKLAAHLGSEQAAILKEIGFVRTKIEHIKQIVATQQSYGKVMGLTESIRVEELVDDVVRIQAVEMSEHQVNVRREYQPKLPEVMLDKHKVLQILLNLLSNAKHACMESKQDKKEVNVRVTNGSERIHVIVSDNGVGITEANMKTIFNHGFTTWKNGGHGFGLHGSALAAKELGGKLAATSDGPGKGATFTLEIPLKKSTATVSQS